MAHSRMRGAVGLAAAAAVAMAYVQVSAVPAPPVTATPSVESIISHVRGELEWARAAIPRSPDWWAGVAEQSSGDMSGLLDALNP